MVTVECHGLLDCLEDLWVCLGLWIRSWQIGHSVWSWWHERFGFSVRRWPKACFIFWYFLWLCYEKIL